MKAPAFWQSRPPSAFARLLQPLGAVYGAATVYRMGRPRIDPGIPVVCVGNFTAGGAGKTPTAIMIARLLQSHGERVIFLSRGYGGARRSSAPLLVDSGRHDFREVGDEPLLLARAAPVVVGADRAAAAKIGRGNGASILVMDDGLQSAALSYVFSIAVVDAGAEFGNGLCLPAGPLRAPVKAQMRHVDAVLYIGEREISDVGSAAQFLAKTQPDPAVLAALGQANCLAFAGIGRPEKFFATLREHRIHVVVRRAFPDHHPYSARDLQGLAQLALRGGLQLITTEKDAVRLPLGWRLENNVRTVPITLHLAQEAAFSNLLFAAIDRYRACAQS